MAKKNVLILGAGLVTKPAVEYLSKAGYAITVASRTVSKAQALIDGLEDAQALTFNVGDGDLLDKLVSEADLAISLLPATYHVEVAKACLRHDKPMVTTSYVSPAMRSLDEEAKAKGLLLLNEIGLDPGIDHMSAMKIIHDVEKRGGKVVSFKSYCGGLPAPEANDNPWGYKFSWSPRGVVIAGTNSARYLEDGEVVEIPGPELFAHHWPLAVPGAQTFEAYPNRDSLGYIELYGLEQAKTMLRGTLRYPGWCDCWKALVDLGMLSLDERKDLAGKTYRQLLAELVGGNAETLEKDLESKLGLDPEGDVMARWRWLGLLSDEPVADEPTVLDVFAHRLQEKLQYAEGERDMIVLHHEFMVEFPEGSKKITSTMIDYGIPGGHSSMARTVSLPAAVGTKLILEGALNLTGVHIPVLPEIYEPVLAELEQMDITCREEEFDL